MNEIRKLIADRRLPPGEAHACFVGNGECLINASWGMDDGRGNEVYCCSVHKVQMDDFAAMLRTLPTEKILALEKAVEKAHAEISQKPTPPLDNPE